MASFFSCCFERERFSDVADTVIVKCGDSACKSGSLSGCMSVRLSVRMQGVGARLSAVCLSVCLQFFSVCKPNCISVCKAFSFFSLSVSGCLGPSACLSVCLNFDPSVSGVVCVRPTCRSVFVSDFFLCRFVNNSVSESGS